MRAMHWLSIAAIVCTATLVVAQDQSLWETNLERAQQTALRTNRLVLIHFYTNSCPPCAQLEREVLSQTQTARALEGNFVLVKLNADENEGTARSYGLKTVPADVIITPDSGRLVASINSPHTAHQYIAVMNQAAQGYRDLVRTAAAQQPGAVGTAVPVSGQSPVVTPPAVASTSPPMNTAPPAAAATPTMNSAPAAAAQPAGNFAGGSVAPSPVTNPYINSASPPATQQAYANERYADYFNRHPSAPAAPAATEAPPIAVAQTPTAPPAYSTSTPNLTPPAYAPGSIAGAAQVAPSNSVAQTNVAPAAPSAPASPAVDRYGRPLSEQPPQAPAFTPEVPQYAQGSVAPGAQIGPSAVMPNAAMPPGVSPPAVAPNMAAVAPAVPQSAGEPPLGLEGYCPVTLSEKSQWVPGNKAYGIVHRGKAYIFAGPEEKNRFWQNPDLYSPVLSGNDPVLALDNQMNVAGRREFGVFFNNRVYLFADEASCRKFEQNPHRYAAEVVQAMR